MLDILKTRRSIRKFKDQDVDDKIINNLIKGILTAPSSRGIRPYELVVVKDKVLLENLSNVRGGASKFIKDSAFSIVVVGNPEVSDVWIEDTSIIAVVTQLYAHSLSLGSCWVQIRNREATDGRKANDYVREILSIPSGLEVECIIALGYPDEEKPPHDLDNLPLNKVHYEKY